jgi:hypothetical protein
MVLYGEDESEALLGTAGSSGKRSFVSPGTLKKVFAVSFDAMNKG